MIRNKVVGWMTLVLVALVGASVFAQSKSATELYGRGVHAYFANDYDMAIELLNQAIEKRDTDPRCYYFRGLATAGLRGEEAALADFFLGAEVEVERADKVYEVNAALQRVQGHLRLEIEARRAAARKAAAERKLRRNKVRYEARKRQEDIVLFDPKRPAPEVDITIPEPELGAIGDPFETGAAFTGGKQVDYAGPEPADTSSEQPVTPGTATDPFANPGATPKAKPVDPFNSGTPPNPGDPEPEPKPTNPFGLPDSPNPFGDPPAGAAAKPNPFGDDMPEENPAPGGGMGAAAPGAGGSIMDLLGKTLSGKAGRDPFGDSPSPEKSAPPEQQPPEQQPPEQQPPEQQPPEQQPPEEPPAKLDNDPFK